MFLPKRPLFALIALVLFCQIPILSQSASKQDIERGQSMLRMVKSDVKDKYYDPKYRGVDLDTRFAAAHEKLKTATSNGHIMGIIAQVLLEFQDSHTRFIPPSRANTTEYGIEIQSVWDRNYVVAVKPKSDAESKGIKSGDEILSIDKVPVERANLWLMRYLYYTLRPKPGMNLTVRHPDGKQEDVTIMAKITTGKKRMDLTAGNDIWDLIRKGENEDRLRRHRHMKLGESVFVWKMPAFDLEEHKIDEMMDKVRELPCLILDLRGNGGGAVKTLNRLIGNFFDHDIKVADWTGRKKFDPQIAKTRGSKYFQGKLFVLIDSESGSASEIFARVMQLEKRGVVIGDVSAGKVMVSRFYDHQSGIDVVAFFGASITEADLIMSDGKSLENVGVNPDKVLLPTPADLAEQKDPVMAHAAELAGVKVTPEQAGKFFPIEWPK